MGWCPWVNLQPTLLLAISLWNVSKVSVCLLLYVGYKLLVLWTRLEQFVLTKMAKLVQVKWQTIGGLNAWWQTKCCSPDSIKLPTHSFRPSYWRMWLSIDQTSVSRKSLNHKTKDLIRCQYKRRTLLLLKWTERRNHWQTVTFELGNTTEGLWLCFMKTLTHTHT